MKERAAGTAPDGRALHTCERCADPHPREWCVPRPIGTRIGPAVTRSIGTYQPGVEQTERERHLDWCELVLACQGRPGWGPFPPDMIRAAADHFVEAARTVDHDRKVGRKKVQDRHAHRRARWEPDIIAAAAEGREALGRLVSKHETARKNAREEANRLQRQDGKDEDGKREARLVAAAGLSTETIYSIARPHMKKRRPKK